MATQTIIHIPDERLRNETKAVTEFDDNLKTLVNDMYDTMEHAKGVGLAAPQIGISLKISVIDVTRERNQRICIINPEIISREGEELMEEGCLSIPGAYDKAPRALRVKVRAQDVDGKFFEIEADGLLAHCLQHEIDHLNGKLFMDYLSPLKRQLIRKKVDKWERRKN